MMVAEKITPWRDALPPVKGNVAFDAPLAPLTWFRTGGPADVLFRPHDMADLVAMIRSLPADVPISVVGVGSNLLIRDGGVRGLVIRFPKSFGGIHVEGANLHVGASALDITVAIKARDAGLAGLEFLRGIPGTIGGALAMNAGAYGREMKEIVVSAMALNVETAEIREFSLGELGYSYRKSALGSKWLFLSATLAGEPSTVDAVDDTMQRILQEREESQPLRTRTGGSTFRNPDPALSGGRSAWQLVDAAGCRGLMVGGAMVSEKHCNFLINTGDATSRDIEDLGEMVRARVLDATGVTLDWEIRRIGEPPEDGEGRNG